MIGPGLSDTFLWFPVKTSRSMTHQFCWQNSYWWSTLVIALIQQILNWRGIYWCWNTALHLFSAGHPHMMKKRNNQHMKLNFVWVLRWVATQCLWFSQTDLFSLWLWCTSLAQHNIVQTSTQKTSEKTSVQHESHCIFKCVAQLQLFSVSISAIFGPFILFFL